MIHKVTTANFKQSVMQSTQPVLVDFWSEWCIPCKQLMPLIEELAKKYQGKLTVASLNVDENPQVAAQNMITSIPTLLFVKDGKVTHRMVGSLSGASIVQQIEKLL